MSAIDNEVLNVLSNAETTGAMLKLVGQLDRSLYTRTNKVLEAAGGKWNRKHGAHVFDGDAAEAMDQIILTGQITKPANFGYFPTPPAIVKRLMELADVRDGHSVLEPSAGRGNIALSLLDAGGDLMAYELLESNADALVKAIVAHPKRGMSMVIQDDFLTVPPSPTFDRVVMNPPFAKQDDIRHVTHALKFLKPDGLLVSVMASSVTFRDNRLTSEFRDLVASRGGSIEEVQDGAFKESGTMVRTVIVAIPSAEAQS